MSDSVRRLLWTLGPLLLLLAIDWWLIPNFFSVQARDGRLYGIPIDILFYASRVMLLSIGMTLVIATGGVDLSVGAVMAMAAATAVLASNSGAPVAIAVIAAMGVALVAGACNGAFVSLFGMQPIVATLVLMVAGRGIAQLITDGQVLTINSSPYEVIGAGYLLMLPVSVLIAAAVVALTVVLLRRTALGMLLESVGVNAEASRLAGIRSRSLTFAVYVFAGLCAGIAGLIISSDVASADGNRAGLLIELDAILAVVIGGTALIGGRFSIAGTVLGAVIIKTLDITIYTVGIPVEVRLLFKAVVVIVLCLAQSPAFRAWVTGRRRRRPAPPPAAADQDDEKAGALA